MYFTHPQIKLSWRNLKKIFLSFFSEPDYKTLRNHLSLYLSKKDFLFTDMGRTAFRLIVKKLNLKNSQILMPAYICDIFYPILKKYHLKPIFLDIDLKTFNVQPEEIEKKITENTRSILVCHTYGLPVDIEKIKEIIIGHPTSTAKHPIIIEDCAHSFGAKYQEKYLGNFGDAAFFSLYKQFPTLRGGMAIWENQKSKIKNQKYLLKTYFSFRDFISLLNCFPFFSFLFKKFGSKIAPKMARKEKLQKLSQINRVSVNLFSYFLNDFEKDLKKRIELARLFQEKLKRLGFETQIAKDNVFCYLSALVPPNLDRDKLVRDLRKYKIFATRIWHTPIILNPKVQKEYHLNPADFKNTLEAAKRIINFPLQNYYSEKDIQKIISGIKKARNP